jgi:hypothetical protein
VYLGGFSMDVETDVTVRNGKIVTTNPRRSVAEAALMVSTFVAVGLDVLRPAV